MLQRSIHPRSQSKQTQPNTVYTRTIPNTPCKSKQYTQDRPTERITFCPLFLLDTCLTINRWSEGLKRHLAIIVALHVAKQSLKISHLYVHVHGLFGLKHVQPYVHHKPE